MDQNSLYPQDWEVGGVLHVQFAEDVAQFTMPPHHIKFVIAGAVAKYELLKNQIQKVFQLEHRPLSAPLYPGQLCIVHHATFDPDNYNACYQRAVIKALLRNNMVKVILVDTASAAVVHTSKTYSMIPSWNSFEQRIITCELHGLSDFASSFHLTHILQNQISWMGEIRATITKGGAIPTVICHSDSYSGVSMNQLVLNYLYVAYDPNILLQKHRYWPNSIITADYENGHMAIQLDTVLNRHLKKNLTLSNMSKKQRNAVDIVTYIEEGVVYLALFHNPKEFERCIFTRISEDKYDVNFIDTGLRHVYSDNYPFQIFSTLPHYPSITCVPPLCAEVKLMDCETLPHYILQSTMELKIEVIIEVDEGPNAGVPSVEVFEAIALRLICYSEEVARANANVNHPNVHSQGFLKRKFSSLHEWSMPFTGHNWGNESKPIFDLVTGTRFYGFVTRIERPGYLWVRPLNPIPLPKFRTFVRPSQLSCGCLWDGNFFKAKSNPDRITRVRIIEPFDLPEPIPHFTEVMRNVKIRAYHIDEGTVQKISVMELAKMGPLSAIVPPQIALIHIEDRTARLYWTEFINKALGKALWMEVIDKKVDWNGGQLMLKAKLLSEPTVEVLTNRESGKTEVEW